MNYSIIFKMLSLVMWVLAIALSFCLGVSFYYSNDIYEAGASEFWISSIAITLAIGLIFYFSSRNAPKKILRKEALCVIGIAWLLCSLIGSMPYMFIVGANFFDAFFESSSGFSTTGGTIFKSFEHFPKSILFWRSLTQWMGGLGVVVFFVAVMSFLGAGAKILYSNEASANTSELESGTMRSGVRQITLIYLGISFVCALVFWLCGLSGFDSICHMLATVPTGGFSTKEASIAHFHNPAFEWAVTFFLFLCGINFILLGKIFRFRFTALLKNTEFWTYLGIVLVCTVIFFICLHDFKNGLSFFAIEKTVRMSIFTIVSYATSTAYIAYDYTTWAPLTNIILIFLMTVCASSGSTSGGMKLLRPIIAVKLAVNEIEREFRPNVVRPISINGGFLNSETARFTMSFIIIYFALIAIGMILLSLFEPSLSFSGCLKNSISFISNIGTSFSDNGVLNDFSFLSNPSKILGSIMMIMGRIELIAILVLFMPSFWREFR